MYKIWPKIFLPQKVPDVWDKTMSPVAAFRDLLMKITK